MKGLELGTSSRDSKYFWKNIALDYNYQLIMCCGLIIYNSKDASKKDPFSKIMVIRTSQISNFKGFREKKKLNFLRTNYDFSMI